MERREPGLASWGLAILMHKLTLNCVQVGVRRRPTFLSMLRVFLSLNTCTNLYRSHCEVLQGILERLRQEVAIPVFWMVPLVPGVSWHAKYRTVVMKKLRSQSEQMVIETGDTVPYHSAG